MLPTDTNENFRYWRWRFGMKRPQWALDRHWYVLVGQLCESLHLVTHYFDVMSPYPKAMMSSRYGRFDPTLLQRQARFKPRTLQEAAVRDSLSSATSTPSRESAGAVAMRLFRARGST